MATALTVPAKALVREPPSVKFAFDVSKTPVAPLATPRPGRSAPLPCVLHAADFASLLVRSLSAGGGFGLTAEPVRAAGQVPQAGAPVRGPEEPGRGEEGDPGDRPHPIEDRLPGAQQRQEIGRAQV